MLTINYDASGLVAKLQGLDTTLRDLTPVWGGVHDIFVDFMREHFASQGSYAGDGWVPLNPSYAAYKARHWPGQGILRRSDELFRSLTEKSHGLHIFNVGPTYAEFGTRSPKGWWHQGDHRASGVPKRIVLPKFTQAEGERVADVILAYMLKTIRQGHR